MASHLTKCYRYRWLQKQHLNVNDKMLHWHRRLQKERLNANVDAVEHTEEHAEEHLLTNVNTDADQSEDDKPKLHHLRRFGCLAYRRIPKEQRIDTKMGARSKPSMMLGYVHNTTKIWRIWDPEQWKVANCSDVEFDKNQTAHISCIDNENDALGLPEQEPIYTEEQVVETGQSGQVVPGNTGQVAHTPRKSGQVAPGNTSQVAHTPGQSGQVAPEVGTPGQSSQVAEPRLQVAPGKIQPSAEKADHLTPDEVVTDPMPSRTVVRPGQVPSSRTTDLRTGQVPSSRNTDLRTGQEPSSSSRTTDLRTVQHTNKGQRTNRERHVTRSHRLTEHTVLAANPSDSNPKSYCKALNSPLYKHWKSAMQEEYASLMENNAFTLVKHTESKPIGCKWVYKTKHYPDGTPRYKARLIVKGYEQVKGVDFDETYAPVGKLTTLCY